MFVDVFGAGVLAFFVGWLWYGAFSKSWVKAMGWSKKQQAKAKDSMATALAGDFVGKLLTASVLQVVLMMFSATNLETASYVVGLLWLGLAVPVLASEVLWQRKPWQLFWINAGYWLLALWVMASVLTF